jgi:hypothetical protein
MVFIVRPSAKSKLQKAPDNPQCAILQQETFSPPRAKREPNSFECQDCKGRRFFRRTAQRRLLLVECAFLNLALRDYNRLFGRASHPWFKNAVPDNSKCHMFCCYITDLIELERYDSTTLLEDAIEKPTLFDHHNVSMYYSIDCGAYRRI